MASEEIPERPKADAPAEDGPAEPSKKAQKKAEKEAAKAALKVCVHGLSILRSGLLQLGYIWTLNLH